MKRRKDTRRAPLGYRVFIFMIAFSTSMALRRANDWFVKCEVKPILQDEKRVSSITRFPILNLWLPCHKFKIALNLNTHKI